MRCLTYMAGVCAVGLLMAMPVFAATLAVKNASAQCSLDKPDTSAAETFVQCPVGDTDNFLIGKGFTGARLNPEITQSQTPIWVHGVCHYVDAQGLTNPLFIPFATNYEWAAFLDNTPAQVNVANCCLPRAMRTTDVPAPKQGCVNGDWHFENLVDFKTRSKILAKPAKTVADTQLVLVDSVSENADAPIHVLPIDRDDAGKVLPTNAAGYVGHFTCKGASDAYVEFRMQCQNAQWQGVNASDPLPATGDVVAAVVTPEKITETANTIEATQAIAQEVVTRGVALAAEPAAGCSSGDVLTTSRACPTGAGRITRHKYYNSCTKQMDFYETNTCGGVAGVTGCFETTNTTTTACPAGTTGSIVQSVQHVCDGSNGGDGRDITTMVSNTCSAGTGPIIGPIVGPVVGACSPMDALTTEPCPAPSLGGVISFRVQQICDGSNFGLGQFVKSQVNNSCISASGCTQSAMLSFSTPCPNNQTGRITSKRVQDSCTNQIQTIVVSNTCN